MSHATTSSKDLNHSAVAEPPPLDQDPTMQDEEQQQPENKQPDSVSCLASPQSTVVVEEPTDESFSAASLLEEEDHNLIMVESPPPDGEEDRGQKASGEEAGLLTGKAETPTTTTESNIESKEEAESQMKRELDAETHKNWPFASVRLVASWEDNPSTVFSASRLRLEDDTKPQFAKLQAIANQQFQVPGAALSFTLAPTTASRTPDSEDFSPPPNKPPLQRITCDDDLADCALGQLDVAQQLVLHVHMELATVIRVCFPTHDEKKTLSRRIPLQTILSEDNNDGQTCYDKLLLTVSETLGTDEFVLTYMAAQRQNNNTIIDVGAAVKYFITSNDDLWDALKQFSGITSELILTPEIPDQSTSEQEEQDDALEALPTTLEADGDEVEVQVKNPDPCVRLSYQGRDGSSVTYPMDAIKDDMDMSRASFWKLVGLATKAFYLGVTASRGGGNPPPICLFYVAMDGTKAQVASDSYLQELVDQRLLSKPLTTELHIRVEPVAFSISTFSNGVSIRQFSLSHILYNHGRSVSFSKLVRLARMADPVKGLIYHDLTGTRTGIGNDKDLVNALQAHPTGDLLIRPTIQENPFILSVRDASLSGKKCKIGSWSTPNIMLKSDNAMAVWDLSQMVPGKYQVSTQYWRDLNQGQVNLLMGAVLGTDVKTVTKALTDLRLRAKLLPRLKLDASGLNESDFTQKILGSVDVRPCFDNAPPGSETCFLAVAVSPEQNNFPDVFVSDMELTYTGPLEL